MIVVDTHVILWDALSSKSLSKAAKKAIQQANNTDGIFICDISLWEIAMLLEKGRVTVDLEYQEFIEIILNSNQYHLCSITPQIAECSVKLPAEVNFDPADRLIAATAIIYDATLLTADKNLRKSKIVPTLW